jgi:hypothetical protein
MNGDDSRLPLRGSYGYGYGYGYAQSHRSSAKPRPGRPERDPGDADRTAGED